jgi:hypothetical protein
MPFARIPALRQFPGRITHIDLERRSTDPTRDAWELEATVLNPLTYSGSNYFKSDLAFVEVDDKVAAELRGALFSPTTAGPSLVNPQRFEIVATKEEAEAIEQADRATLRSLLERGVGRHRVDGTGIGRA